MSRRKPSKPLTEEEYNWWKANWVLHGPTKGTREEKRLTAQMRTFERHQRVRPTCN